MRGIEASARPSPSAPIRPLGAIGKAYSESGTLALEGIAAAAGVEVAADAASGMADARERFARQHPAAFENR